MPAFEDHCNESMLLFGNSYKDVHLWLDEYAGKPPYGMKHRKLRHHEEGIRQVVKLFGPKAGMAARQHVVSDLRQEGWSEDDPFPRNEAHYVYMGLF